MTEPARQDARAETSGNIEDLDERLADFLSTKRGIGGDDWASGKYLIPDLTDEQKEPSSQHRG